MKESPTTLCVHGEEKSEASSCSNVFAIGRKSSGELAIRIVRDALQW